MLRVDGAQFVAADLPGDEGGPPVVGVQLLSSRVHPGERARSLSASVGPRSSAVLVALQGDAGYSQIKPGAIDPTTGVLSFKTTLSFSPDLQPGTYKLVVQAVDPDGVHGAPNLVTLQAELEPIDGKLVVSLAWATEADLDLHVIDPAGVEIWARNITSFQAPPPGTPRDPDAKDKAGVLDADSNAQCVLDGRRRENVIWKTFAPPGSYVVRVDAPSLCGQSISAWFVEARLDGALLGGASGFALPNDADRFPHERGSGVTALVFKVPP